MHPLLRLAPLFGPQRRLLALSVAGLCASSALGLLGPWIVATAIDGPMNTGDQPAVLRLAGAYLAVVIAAATLAWTSRVGSEIVAQGAMLRLKEQLFDHLVGHDQAFHDEHASGRLITRVEGDTEALRVLFTEVVLTFPADVAMLVGMAAFLLAKSAVIAAMVFAVSPLYLLCLVLFRTWSRSLFLSEREVRARLTGFLAEAIRAMPTLRRYDREPWVRGRADVENELVYRREVASGVAGVVFFNSVFLVRTLGFALVLWGGALLVLRGSLTVGTLVMGVGYLRQMFGPLMRLSNNLSTVERARAAGVRVAEIMDTKRTITDPPAPVAWPGLNQAIRLEGVSFAYAPEVPVLREVDLEVPAGTRVGVVGATGSGKSTIVGLLLRFRDPVHGRVTVDGVDLRAMRVDEIRHQVGLVLQDVHLFPGTVLDNLGGDPVRATRALRTLDIDLPLDHRVAAEGSNLSRGERQLLTFARALVNEPSVLVLDEATSAVDPLTEARVQEALERLLAGRTTVIVAHRLATVRDCDRIYVLSAGRVVEAGTHDELIDRRGAYAALYELQHGVAA